MFRLPWPNAAIVYPNGEKVTYGYDRGGQVVSVKGEHWGHDFDYVTNILYDQYGQRTRIDYGNGTFTEYNYDSVRRWLDTIKTENKWGQSYQNISYSFDAVGNVLGYENNCLDNVIGNYKTRQTYSYDNLYQLIKVEGETTYDPYHSELPEFVSNYSQNFEFDTDGLGNMTSKVSKESVSPLKKIGDNLNYNFTYVYDENFAHRLVRAGDRYYKYDSNGKIVWYADYEAFGSVMNERGEKNFTPNYTGKFFDKTTGLYYFNARWYDCELGRFTTQDPARDGVNWWIYCNGNPITFVDPDGREIISTNVWYAKEYMQMYNANWPNSKESISDSGCTLIASNRVANVAIHKFGYTIDTPKPSSIIEMLSDTSLTSPDGIIFSGLKGYLESFGVDALVYDTGKEGRDIKLHLEDAVLSEDSFFVIGRIPGKDGNDDHFVNINYYSILSNKITASDTSMTPNGTPKRDLSSVDSSMFDRLIIIQVKQMKEN